MKQLKTTLTFIFVLFFISCSSGLTSNEVAALTQNIVPGDVKNLLSVKPEYTFPLEIDQLDENIIIEKYTLKAKGYRSDYILCYKSDKLYFWGYPHEFLRENDHSINEIGRKSIAYINQFDKHRYLK